MAWLKGVLSGNSVHLMGFENKVEEFILQERTQLRGRGGAIHDDSRKTGESQDSPG